MWANEYKDGYLKKEEYQQQMLNVLKRHPDLVLTFAHFGFMSDKPEFVEKLFNEYKTVYFDNVPGPEEYFVIAKNPAPWKRIMEKYSDRYIFGTDRGNHGTEGFTKEEYLKLQNRIEMFQAEEKGKIKKGIQYVLITNYGLSQSQYNSIFSKVITFDSLF